ncbi:MAG: hypothetical protein ACRDJL_03450 [Actinomycetota bacterium]
MKTTIFEVKGPRVALRLRESPDWKPFDDYDGRPLRAVELVELEQVPNAELQLVRIRSGGHFVMHTSPHVAYCQIIEGRGTLALPEEHAVSYEGPELYVFMPGSLHEWRDIEEDTLLSVCLVKQS